MTINLEDDNVFQASLTIEQARKVLDDYEFPEELATQWDEAQAYVHQGNGKSYLIIEIQ